MLSDSGDGPYQIRPALQQQQQSPACGIVAASSAQTQVMSPSAAAHAKSAIDQRFHLQFATETSLPSVLRLQQKEFLHVLISDRTIALSALSSLEEVQKRLDDLNSDMQLRT